MDFSRLRALIVSILVLNQQHFLLGDMNVLAYNKIERRIDDYLEYCPYSSTCNTSASASNELFWNWYIGSCCMDCECDSGCGLDCCPDKSVVFENEEEFYNAKELKRCIDAQNRPFDERIANGQSFVMVSKCPYRYGDIEIATKCARKYRDVKFDVPLRYLLPAYDDRTNSIYKNIFCAKCHDVEVNSLEFAGIRFSCLTKIRNLTYVRDIGTDTDKTENDDCNIMFKPPDAVSQSLRWYSKACDRAFISRCNVTGLWKTYDRHLEEACLSYRSVYENYRNVHCFLCNGFNESDIRRSCNHSYDENYRYYSRRTESDGFSFMAVFDWSRDSQSPVLGAQKQEPTDGDVYCLQDGLLDLSKVDEWYLHCPDGMVLQNGTCLMPLLDKPSYILMEIDLVLEPKDISEEESMYTVNQVLSTVFNKIDEKMSLLISQDLERYNVRGFVVFKTDMKYSYQEKVKFPLRAVLYIAVEIQIHVTRLKLDYFDTLLDFALVFSNVSDFGFFMAKFHHFTDGFLFYSDTCTTVPGRPNYLLCVRSSNDRNGELQFQISRTDLDLHTLQMSSIIINLEPEPFCPRIALPKQHLCNQSVHFEQIYTDDFLHTKLSENETHIFFCHEDYFQHLHSLQLDIDEVDQERLPSENGFTLYNLSIACLSASLLSLILTLVVYSVYPVLRSLPGLNNMALVTSLILFQALTLVNTVSRIDNSWLCAVVGAFTHFSLILSFAWMFVCTFHMLKVFVKIRNRSVGRNDMKTFVLYLAFTTIVAILGVTITSIAVMVQSGGKDMGYGGVTCYIKNSRMIIFVVAVPVAVVTILNIVMFGIVVFRVHKLPILASSNPQDRNNITIFVKLSTITGITWVFGFIYIFTQIDMFAYIFVLLNAGQGVFIMLSFVCNRRVLNLVFKTMGMKRTETKQVTSTQQM